MSINLAKRAIRGSHPVATWAGIIAVTVPGGPAVGSIVVNVSGALAGSNYSGDSAWYIPASGTPGNNYYVKFTTVGNAWDAGLVSGTVYALTSNRTITWTATGSAKNGTLTVSIYSDAGGTVLVGTGTVDYSVDGSP